MRGAGLQKCQLFNKKRPLSLRRKRDTAGKGRTKRNEQELQLVLFTLLPIDDDYKDAIAQEEVMTLLSEAIFTSLRRVDISVRFSSTQYLVALMDTKPEFISVVTDRIMQNFYMMYRGHDFVLDYDVAKVKRNINLE